ncbi:MAG: tetratricopeptide repeat protein, partial [Candidatus Nanopelagicales bacterium]|nr:tetratricopeptide repeat protein [Candidatus Nanopelagicales bacterium]
ASETSFRRALSIDDTLAGAYTGLGVTLARLNRLPEALDAWLRAVSLDPHDFNALFNLTMELFESGQAGEARRYGEQFVATAPPAFFAADIARVRARLAGGRF